MSAPPHETIVHFVNIYPKIGPVVLQDIDHVDKIKTFLQEYHPNFSSEMIGFYFSKNKNNFPSSSMLSAEVPSNVTEIYVSFYLKKHPKLPIKLNSNSS